MALWICLYNQLASHWLGSSAPRLAVSDVKKSPRTRAARIQFKARVPMVQLTHPRTAPGPHLPPSSELPALHSLYFLKQESWHLIKYRHRRGDIFYPPSLIWLLLALHKDCHHRITRTRFPIYDWHVTGVFTVVKISPTGFPPPLTWPRRSHIRCIMPPLLSSLCLMHLPLCHSLTTTSHKNRCLASLLCY